jgi:hypothetical protein
MDCTESKWKIENGENGEAVFLSIIHFQFTISRAFMLNYPIKITFAQRKR